MRLLIVDDHQIVIKGFRYILSKAKDIEIAGEANTGEEAIRKIRHEKYDLVILDLSLPDMSGIQVLKEIKKISPNLPVLILTMYSEKYYAIQVIKAGVWGYITKDTAAETLIEAINTIRKGKKYISPNITEEILNIIEKGESEAANELLSDREIQVLRGIYHGKSLKEIASELYISEKTISTYRRRILDKLGLHSNADLVKYIDKNRFLFFEKL